MFERLGIVTRGHPHVTYTYALNGVTPYHVHESQTDGILILFKMPASYRLRPDEFSPLVSLDSGTKSTRLSDAGGLPLGAHSTTDRGVARSTPPRNNRASAGRFRDPLTRWDGDERQ